MSSRMKDFFTSEVLRHHVKCLEAKKHSLQGKYQITKQIFREIERIGDEWDKKGYALSLKEIKAADDGIITTTRMILNEIRSSELEIEKYLKSYEYVYEDFSWPNEPNYFMDYGGKFVMPHKSVGSECARFIDGWRHIFMARNLAETVLESTNKDSDAMISTNEEKPEGEVERNIRSLVEEGYSHVVPNHDRPVWIDESDGNTLRDIMWIGFYIDEDGTKRRIEVEDFKYNEKVLEEWKSGPKTEPPYFIDPPNYSNQVFSFYIKGHRMGSNEKFGRILGIDSMLDLQAKGADAHDEKGKIKLYPWDIASTCKFTFNRTVGEVELNSMKVRRTDDKKIFTRKKAEEEWFEFCKNEGIDISKYSVLHSHEQQAVDSNKSSSSSGVSNTNKEKTSQSKTQGGGADDEDDIPLAKLKRKSDFNGKVEDESANGKPQGEPENKANKGKKEEEGKKQRTGISQKVFFVDLSCEESSSSSDSDDLYASVLKPIIRKPTHHNHGKFMGIYFLK